MKAAIFDMDGTLIDSLFLWGVIWSAFGEQYLGDPGFSPSAEDDKTVRTLTLDAAMEMIHRNYQIGESGAELLALANRIIEDFYANRVELKSGVGEFLEYCASHGVKMCIASATAPELIKVAIKHCGIGKYFVKVISCEEVGAGKEKPDVFLAAAKALGTQVCDTWVFEDSLTAIETAAKAGFHTVGIYDPNNFGHETMQRTAEAYIGPGESLLKLIKG